MKVADIFKNKSFKGLFVSQVTGAFNDNALKMILVGIVMATKPVDQHDSYLALLNALLIVPFVLLSPLAGWFADRFSKRSVLLIFKITEFFILGLVLATILKGGFGILFLLLFFMGAQSTFYSPAKYGILKEIVPEKRLGQANGMIEMGTILAIIVGTVGGAFLYDIFKTPTAGAEMALTPFMVLGIASLAGLIFTFQVEKVSAGSHDTFNLKGFRDDLTELKNNRTLKLTVAGICYFWFAAMLLNLLLILFGTQTMGLQTVSQASILFLYLCIGVAIGSGFAAKASKHRVELGLIPAGSIGMGVTTVLLPFLAATYSFVVVDIVLLGIFAGIFLVPLNTLLQLASDDDKRGRFIAMANMFSNVGMLVSSVVLVFFSNVLKLFPSGMLFALGLLSFGVSIYIFYLLPEAFLRFSVGIVTHLFYRIDSVNPEMIPQSGPVLLTPNHMSLVDGLLFYFSVPHRKVRFLVDRDYFSVPLIGWVLKTVGCIPVSPDKAKDAIIQAVDALNQGEVVGIFPEGTITRIGTLLPFKKGLELILRKAPADTAVVPVSIDKIWGSIFSFKKQKFIWKVPERIPYPVTINFGKPQKKTIKAFELRQKVSELSSEAFLMRESDSHTLPAHFIKTAKRCLFRKAVVDITQKPLTYLELLTKSILFSEELKKNHGENEKIGIMLPACVAGVISNVAVAISGNVAVNLNFTAGDDALNKAITKCEMKTILTSKLFVKKAGLTKLEQFVYVEDLAKNIKPADKTAVFLSVLLMPAVFLKNRYCKKDMSHDDIATIMFSSGSTADPKGVMLSHFNITSNGEMLNQVLHLQPDDKILGSLPFFHSFGYTTTLWFALLHGVFAAYVPDPLDAKKVGEMAQKYQITIMLGTPTFYRTYIRKCDEEQFKHIRLAVAGAERLRQSVADGFLKKFGCPIIEGYGATEMSPIISCNLPDYEDGDIFQKGTKPGSVGLPLPGLSAKIVNPENYEEDVPDGQEGMLLVKGPNRMVGYLNDEKRTSEALHNEWYVTGDIARIDDEGFLHIVGRLSRFAKIAGEMVPHGQIEETINKVLGFEEQLVVVTSVPDSVKGEKLIVLYLPQASACTDTKMVIKKIKDAGLPNLWVPKEFYEVEKFPMLATGKLDIRGFSAMAQELSENKN